MATACGSSSVNAQNSGNTTTTAPAITAANEIRACEEQHDMQSAATVNRSGNSATFMECDWPPSAGESPDGYQEVEVVTLPGPGTGEATNATRADYISATCQTIELQYDIGNQGVTGTTPKFRLSIGAIAGSDPFGKPWTGKSPYPYPNSQTYHFEDL